MKLSMLGFEVLDNGDLKITADNWARSELAQMNNTARDYWEIMSEAFDDTSIDGGYTHFDPGQSNPFVGLTSAPCIAESIYVDEIGTAPLRGGFGILISIRLLVILKSLRTKAG